MWSNKGNSVYFLWTQRFALNLDDVFNSEAFAGNVDGYCHDSFFFASYPQNLHDIEGKSAANVIDDCATF